LKFRIAAVITLFFLISGECYSQFFPRFSIAGGPTVGWHWNNVDDLNAEMRKIGIPEFPKDGFLIIGGGGFIDLPFKSVQWLRLGGMGTGFTSKRQITQNDVTRTVYYSYGTGGISFDYVFRFGRRVEMTLGALLTTGKLSIELYQDTPTNGNWNTIWNELNGSGSTQNISHKLSVRFYSGQPQAGVGFFVTDFLYAKLNAGYEFSTNTEWKVDDGVLVPNAPEGIKANGFNINFGLNVGLFTK